MRRASDFAGGEEATSGEVVGAGVEVRDRGVFLTGDGSVAGKSPWGCERVATMMTIRNFCQVKSVGFTEKCERRNGREGVTCCDDAEDVRERLENGSCFSREGLYLPQTDTEGALDTVSTKTTLWSRRAPLNYARVTFGCATRSEYLDGVYDVPRCLGTLRARTQHTSSCTPLSSILLMYFSRAILACQSFYSRDWHGSHGYKPSRNQQDRRGSAVS
jgi:hypothetical protein